MTLRLKLFLLLFTFAGGIAACAHYLPIWLAQQALLEQLENTDQQDTERLLRILSRTYTGTPTGEQRWQRAIGNGRYWPSISYDPSVAALPATVFAGPSDGAGGYGERDKPIGHRFDAKGGWRGDERDRNHANHGGRRSRSNQGGGPRERHGRGRRPDHRPKPYYEGGHLNERSPSPPPIAIFRQAWPQAKAFTSIAVFIYWTATSKLPSAISTPA